METVAVLTFHTKSKDGKTYTCNMVEGLDITMSRIKERFDDLKRKGCEPAGDIVLNFVTTEK